MTDPKSEAAPAPEADRRGDTAASAARVVRLTPHPGSPCGAVEHLEVTVETTPGGMLRLVYRLTGEMAALSVPAPGAPIRTDGLWRHTCFEVFVAPVGEQHYLEANFSPSHAWALYCFEAYRQGMKALSLEFPPEVVISVDSSGLTLDVKLVGAPLSKMRSARRVRLGLAAVIEERCGRLSYWALSHPADKPDFHDPRGFLLELKL